MKNFFYALILCTSFASQTSQSMADSCGTVKTVSGKRYICMPDGATYRWPTQGDMKEEKITQWFKSLAHSGFVSRPPEALKVTPQQAA